MWPNQLSSGRITLQLKRFLFHIYLQRRKRRIYLFSMSLLERGARLFLGLSAGDGAPAKVDDLGVYLSAPLQDRNVVHVVCAIIYKTNHFLPIKRESAQKRVGVCAHNAMHASVCFVFSCSASLAHFGLQCIVLAPHIYTSRMCGLKIYGRFAQ